ncbi:predicted protein [Nematostella vectensis]|uniref:Calx-beta domain-containing protein n=1 Tax=Nematostella vectensis TaxID=45351 RepID=A7SI33_NEMVE|nr:predicted protein [Nematostella vectensis]|eukprot:XP_001628717.1 predicted protein [Nematostella vectensis]
MAPFWKSFLGLFCFICLAQGQIFIKFSAPSYTFSEGANAVLPIERSGNTTVTSTVRVEIIPETAKNGTHYLTPGALDVQLTPGVTSLPFNLTLVDTDDIVKANTEFRVMLSSSDPNVNVTQGDAIVRIQDNDKVLAGFTKLTESVDEESGFISLCVAVKGKSDIPLSVYVTTENEGTSSSDLQKLDKHQVMLLADRNVTCFNVTILDDDVPEGDEHFSVSLSSNDSRVTVDSGYSSIRVTIRDIKDKVTIQFAEPLIFVVSEGNSIPLKLNCTYHDIPFNVSLEISPNVFDTTADISDIVLTAIEFPAGVTNVTYNLATVADGKAESDEVMTLKIKSSVSWLVIGENDSIKAKITDEVDRGRRPKNKCRGDRYSVQI